MLCGIGCSIGTGCDSFSAILCAKGGFTMGDFKFYK
jgi:hypothetical protein